jgi:hypothetical protein
VEVAEGLALSSFRLCIKPQCHSAYILICIPWELLSRVRIYFVQQLTLFCFVLFCQRWQYCGGGFWTSDNKEWLAIQEHRSRRCDTNGIGREVIWQAARWLIRSAAPFLWFRYRYTNNLILDLICVFLMWNASNKLIIWLSACFTIVFGIGRVYILGSWANLILVYASPNKSQISLTSFK